MIKIFEEFNERQDDPKKWKVGDTLICIKKDPPSGYNSVLTVEMNILY